MSTENQEAADSSTEDSDGLPFPLGGPLSFIPTPVLLIFLLGGVLMFGLANLFLLLLAYSAMGAQGLVLPGLGMLGTVGAFALILRQLIRSLKEDL